VDCHGIHARVVQDGRQMIDQIDARASATDGIVRCDVSLDQFNPVAKPSQIVAHTGAEIVQNPDQVTACQQSFGQMRTKEARTASDKNRHQFT
jgi:hypothetical protein